MRPIWGGFMIDRSHLEELAEIFFYVDLLSSIIALYIYYERIRLNDADAAVIAREKQELNAKFVSINERIEALEESFNTIEDLLRQIICEK
ncbi:MAG: hypothetical protein K0R78_2780 [Pelosinus sp.]|nr:hypothetical protein [Pelosinus sp.]